MLAHFSTKTLLGMEISKTRIIRWKSYSGGSDKYGMLVAYWDPSLYIQTEEWKIKDKQFVARN